jgi:penicillin amidase
LALLAILATGALLAWGYWRAHACLAQLQGAIKVPGLAAPVEVLRDARGVPHLRAQALEDLLFAQGFVTAQDRLWQMDLSRRLARGELSEIFGERTLKFDVENRTLGLGQVAERAATELDAESQRLLAAYTRGVNAFLSQQEGRLPIEFLILRYTPRPWREADSLCVALNMAKTLSTSWPDELMRERVRARVAGELYADLFPERSALDHPVAEPLTPRDPVLIPRPEAPIGILQDFNSTLAAVLQPLVGGREILGSNNWVVSGRHTQSGKPLLANDPHLSLGVPSVWYMIHLKAPGVNISGVSFPGLPAVILGHNERIAWGATNTAPDVQDLYVESFNFREPHKYLQEGAWVESSQREETVQVRGGREYTFRITKTGHGPIVSQDGERDLALRWTALEPGALRFPFLQIGRAQNWKEFTVALRDFAGPVQNFVYADVDGNIGYYAAGWIPIRKRGDGSLPAPGSSGEYEWRGYIPFEDLPHAYNPPSGILATANGRVVPDGYPFFLTHKWAAPYRTARIFELLERGSRFTVQDMLRIQGDIRALDGLGLAKQLVAAAARRPPERPDTKRAISLLAEWDGEARADSAATLLVETSRQVLLEQLLRPKLGEDLAGYHWPMSTTFIQNVIEQGWKRWLPPGDADFDQTLLRSLDEAVERIRNSTGRKDPQEWQWGETNSLTFRHPLGGLRYLGRFLNVGPFPQAGTGETVRQATPSVGASMRMVVDLAQLDNSVQNITLGQSGQVFSPHYKDQFDAWYQGGSFPMPFSDAAVDRGTVHRLVLEPARQP